MDICDISAKAPIYSPFVYIGYIWDVKMFLFRYKVLDNTKQTSEKFGFARDVMELSSSLKKNGFFFISAKKQRSSIKKPIENFTIPFLKNLRQLVSNNIDLVEALGVIKQLFSDGEEKSVIRYITHSIMNGFPLSYSISHFKKYFHVLVIKAIEIAEKTANLAEILGRLVDYLEASTDIQRKIKNILYYPMILVSCAIIVIMFWLLVVIPKFAELFRDIGSDLPLITRIMIRLSTFTTGHLGYIGICIAAILCFGFVALKDKERRTAFFAKIPILKNLQRENFAMSFFSAMELMMCEKINLIDGLRCFSDTRNSDKICAIINSIENGSTLSKAMKESAIFDNFEISIIENGEKSGDLWPAFNVASNMLRLRLEKRFEKIIHMAQPTMIIFVGVLLLMAVYSIIVPMYSNLDLSL
ncbi:MAG: type II secretion system F family protein [Bacteroidales bacterium]|jgi:type IV pilus assembly protein PilC|nr:type II secretion system F family protein [Bacteroidales bacterium]